jgi:hypothetical protein
MIVTDQYLALSGLKQIIALKAHFTKGLSPLLSNAFPDIPSFTKPEFIPSSAALLPASTSTLDLNRIAGFVNGDSCFTLGFSKRSQIMRLLVLQCLESLKINVIKFY